MDAQEIKDKIDFRAFVMDDLGVYKQVHGDGALLFLCPFHTERTPSFAVYPDHATCFGACGFKGDVFTYVQQRTGKSFKEVLQMLSGEYELPRYERKSPLQQKLPARTVLSMQEVQRYAFDVDLVKPYITARGIPDEIVEANLLGGTKFNRTYTDMTGTGFTFEVRRVCIPYIFNGQVYSQNFRRDDLHATNYLATYSQNLKFDIEAYLRNDLADKMGVHPSEITREQILYYAFGPRYYKPRGTKTSIYGVEQVIKPHGSGLLYPRMDYALLTEGEINKLTAQKYGLTCLSLAKTHKIDLRRVLQNVKEVIVPIDDDAAGAEYAKMIVEATQRDPTRIRFMPMKHGYNDMNDMDRAKLLVSYLNHKPYCLNVRM